MILSDRSILEFVEAKKLVISPFDKEAVQPASLDCKLGDHFMSLDEGDGRAISLDSELRYQSFHQDKFIIKPKGFILATTQEYLELPDNLTAFVEGRSSIGRMGLFVQNAGWVDAGFKGNITLELYNANSVPIELEKGRRICQFVFCLMDKKAQKPYQGKYLGQRSTTGSRIYEDVEAKLP